MSRADAPGSKTDLATQVASGDCLFRIAGDTFAVAGCGLWTSNVASVPGLSDSAGLPAKQVRDVISGLKPSN